MIKSIAVPFKRFAPGPAKLAIPQQNRIADMRLSSLLLALIVLPLAACQKPAPTEAAKPPPSTRPSMKNP